MAKSKKSFVTAFRIAWCSFWHDNPSWPVNGAYHCRTCRQVYPVEWANSRSPAPVDEKRPTALTTVETHG